MSFIFRRKKNDQQDQEVHSEEQVPEQIDETVAPVVDSPSSEGPGGDGDGAGNVTPAETVDPDAPAADSMPEPEQEDVDAEGSEPAAPETSTDEADEAAPSVDAPAAADKPAASDKPATKRPFAVNPRAVGAHSMTRVDYINRAISEWRSELESQAEAARHEKRVHRARGVIDVTQAHPTGSAQLYSHGQTLLSSLIREESALARAKSHLDELRADSQRIAEVYGYAPMSLTAGRIEWEQLPVTPSEPRSVFLDSYENTGELHLDPSAYAQELAQEAEPEAPEPEAPQPVLMSEPVIFRHITLEFLPGSDARIQLTEWAQVNPAVLAGMRAAGVPSDQLAQIATDAKISANADRVVRKIVSLGHVYLSRFRFDPQVLIGCFARPEQGLLEDLNAMEPFIRTSGVMAALAGDQGVRDLTAAPLPPGSREDRAPEVERGVGDRDVDELHAVEAVASGRSLVLDCPPGTERIETIVSIAADAAASGRSVMIVPARASQARVLAAAFERAGVGELVADFSHPEQVPMRLRTGLRLDKPEIDRDSMLKVRTELTKSRGMLANFVEALHRKDPKWGTSVHDLLEQLADLAQGQDAPRTKIRFKSEAVAAIGERGLQEVHALLDKASEVGAFDTELTRSAWLDSGITTRAEADEALAVIEKLRGEILPRVTADVARAASQAGLRVATTPTEWFDQLNVLDGISQTLDTFVPKFFETSPEQMVIATASKEWREERGYKMKSAQRRQIRKQAEDLVRPGANVKDLHAELKLAQDRRDSWRRYVKDAPWPVVPERFSQLRRERQEFAQVLEQLSTKLHGRDLVNMTFAEIDSLCNALEKEQGHLDSMTERNSYLSDFRELGMSAFVSDISARQVPADRIRAEFDLAYASSVFEQLISGAPILAKLGPRDVLALLDYMRALDTAHVESLAAPVNLAVVNEMRRFARENRDDTIRVDRALARMGTAGLRDILASYARLMQFARPVWITPKGVVAQYLPAAPYADVCIVDTDSHVKVASTVSAVMRGRQAVVVGDVRRSGVLGSKGEQASKVEGDGANELAIDAFAKVLPHVTLPTTRALLSEITVKALRAHGYEGIYTPIPERPGMRLQQLVVVDGRGVPANGGEGAIESTKAEVDAVVDAVVEHVLDEPERSLAVIAGNATHAQRVADAIAKVAGDGGELARFIRGDERDSDEKFIVTDILHAAGLRRDHVIFAVGFGKTIHGRLLHSFGDLATPRGFTGLIDTIEDARYELTVVSAIGSGEIDTARISTPGPKLLADVISAAAGETSEGSDSATAAEDAPEDAKVPALVDDLARRLAAHGWKTALNFGYSGSLRIPLVVGRDDIPGVWAVAVLFDDDAYVSERSLRRRDRHRIEAYERAGWAVFQTYSTSLFVDPAGQAQAIAELAESVVNAPTADERSSQKAGAAVTAGAPVASAPAVFAADADASEGAGEALRERGPRPKLKAGLQLSAYSDDELDEMVAWIASDGKARGRDELVEELRNEIGLVRRGGQVDAVLRNVVNRSGFVTEAKPAEAEAEKAESKADAAAAASEAKADE